MTTASEPRPAARGAGDRRAPAQEADAPPPKLAADVELLGEYRDSGLREPPYLARRGDGGTIQLSRLLHAVAEQCDGRRRYTEIAERVTEELGRPVSADNVRFLVDEKLRPLGVLAQTDGTSPAPPKADPLLALKLRAAVVPAGVTRALTTIFRPLFLPPVVLAVLASVVAVDIWLFFVHGVAQSTREVIYNPVLLLMVLGLVVLATALHEIGHATAARYGGAEPGVMGVGVYVVWPAFYTDVTDAYRLDRRGRLRTDLGGIYFNGVFVLAVAAAYWITRFEPLLVLVVIQHLQVLQQLLPFLRLDGYYVLSDLTGVPDLFTRIKPTLKSALPGRPTDARVAELKRWVRVVTTGWVLILIPVLVAIFALLAFNAPRMVATAYDSFFVHKDRVASAFGRDDAVAAIAGSIQIAALALPLAGMTYSFGRVSARIVRGAWSWSEGAPLRRGVVAMLTVAGVAGAAYVLVPNGDYEPIQPGERGTLQGGWRQFSHVTTGRPSLTEERERELGGGTAARRDAERPTDGRDAPPGTSPTGPPESGSVPSSSAPNAEPTTTATDETTTEPTQPTATTSVETTGTAGGAEPTEAPGETTERPGETAETTP
jgi:putative peptide zinc metalloprotease protein